MPGALAAAGLAVRRARADDAPFLRGLYGAGRAVELAPLDWPPVLLDRFLDSQFAARAVHYATVFPDADDLILTCAAGRPIGRLLVCRGRPLWRIVDVALIAEAQGGGRGTGLIRRLQRLASTAGAAGIDLNVTIDNPRAAALYLRLGFAPTAFETGAVHRRLVWPSAGDPQLNTA